eukprot:1191588-Prorocentrum_minimum.AAC.2
MEGVRTDHQRCATVHFVTHENGRSFRWLNTLLHKSSGVSLPAVSLAARWLGALRNKGSEQYFGRTLNFQVMHTFDIGLLTQNYISIYAEAMYQVQQHARVHSVCKFPLGLDTDIKPLIRPLPTGEFSSPPFFHGRPKSAEDENCPLSP